VTRKLPFLIAVLRIVLTLVYFYAYLFEFRTIAIVLFITAILTDIIDGFLAKKLKVTSESTLESYIDAIADFVFVTTAFFAFAISGIYPIWIPIILIIMFLFFVISSKSRKPVYDPIGKYYGSFLLATIGFTLIFPIEIVYNFIFLIFLVYTIILALYRTNFLVNLRKSKLNSEDLNDSLK
jgi:phosphatidylglycerophosphate synthase